MAVKPILESSVRTTPEGDWEIAVPPNITPGLHKLRIISESGEEREAFLFVERTTTTTRERPTLVERFQRTDTTQPLIPPVFAYAIFFFLLIIIALSINNVRLGRLADERAVKRRRYTRNAVVLSSIAIVLAFLMGLILNQTTGVFDRPPTSVETVYVSVEGAVVTPFENVGVPGVDLVADETRVRTTEGGRYVFSRVGLDTGIRITHPELSRAIIQTFEDAQDSKHQTAKIFPATIYFDASLYNTLIQIIDLEARARYGDVYPFLAPQMQARISVEDFAGTYPSIFGREDITDQELVVEHVITHRQWISELLGETLENVVEIGVRNADQRAEYFFLQTPDGWKLLKFGVRFTKNKRRLFGYGQPAKIAQISLK